MQTCCQCRMLLTLTIMYRKTQMVQCVADRIFTTSWQAFKMLKHVLLQAERTCASTAAISVLRFWSNALHGWDRRTSTVQPAPSEHCLVRQTHWKLTSELLTGLKVIVGSDCLGSSIRQSSKAHKRAHPSITHSSSSSSSFHLTHSLLLDSSLPISHSALPSNYL